MLDINWNPNNKELRVFSALLIVFGIVLATMVNLRTGHVTLTMILLAVFVLLGAGGLLRPRLMRHFYVIWMAIVFPVGWTVSLIVMAVTFYVVLTPIGLARRLIRRDPLERRFDRDARSYWRKRPQRTDTDRYFRQF